MNFKGSKRALLADAYLPESRALFAAMTVKPGFARKRLINATIQKLKAAGIWVKLDLLYLMAAHDAQAARLNWISPGTATLTASNSPNFLTDRGYKGDGSTSYLDTGVVQNTLTKYTQNSASAGAHSVEQHAGGTSWLVGLSAANIVRLASRNASDQTACFINGTVNLVPSNTNTIGLFAANRSGASASQVYIRGASAATDANASTTLSASSTVVFLKQSANFNGLSRISAGFVGASLSATEHGLLATIMDSYMRGVGAI